MLSKTKISLGLLGGASVAAVGSLVAMTSTASAQAIQVGATTAWSSQINSAQPLNLITTANNQITLSFCATVTPGNLLTLSLPTGVTFGNTPVITSTNNGAVQYSSGGVGANTLVYQVSASFTDGSIMSLTGFTFTNYGTLAATGTTATPAGLTVRVTGVAHGGVTTQAVSIGTFAPAVTNNSVAGGTTNIDVSSGATRFGTASAFMRAASLATSTNNRYDNTGAASVTSTAATFTVAGDLRGVGTVYVVANTTGCAATVPATAVTSVAASGLSVTTGTGTVAVGTTYDVCLIASGTDILNNTTYTVSASYTLSATSGTASASQTGTTAYSGTVVQVNYFVGSDTTYQQYLWVRNLSTTTGSVLLRVRNADGTSALGTLDANLTAGAAKLYGATEINAAVTSQSLGNSGQRRSLLVLVTQAATVSSLLANPGGTLTTTGSSTNL